MKRLVFGLICLLGLTVAPAADTVLVELGDALRTDARAHQRIEKDLNAALVRRTANGRYLVLRVPRGKSAAGLSREANRISGIAAAAPNATRRLHATPNDPLFSPSQWSMHNTGQTVSFPDPGNPDNNIVLTGLNDADIDGPEAWDITTGSSSVIVAVIDTGLGIGNTDLGTNAWVNEDEISNDGIDNDNNGYVDDIWGFNFSAQNNDLTDNYGHGSFCAGIIGGRGNNGFGIAGVNWQVSIMALKSFSDEGTATDAELVEAIDYAIANGARVINASWGDWLYSPVMENAIRRAGEAGVLFVNSSGNDSTHLEEQPAYPGCMALPNLLNVGATDIRDGWAAFSNYDSTYVDIHAPGYWVYSSRPSEFEYASGTSFATPHVAGVAALMLAAEPGLTVDELRARIIGAVDVRQSLDGRGYTSGRLSAYKALTSAGNDTVSPSMIDDVYIAETGSNGFRILFTAPGDDEGAGNALFYEGRISKEPFEADEFLSQPGRLFRLPSPAEGGNEETFYAYGLDPGTRYYFRLRAYDEAGNYTTSELQSTQTASARVLFFDDMENGTENWVVDGVFQLTDEASYSGQYSWTDSPGGEYERLKSGTLTTGPLDFSNTEDPWLQFYHQHIFANSYTIAGDYGEVLVSTNGTDFTRVSLKVNQLSPFHLARVNLGDYAGEPQVWVRFLFRSDFSLTVGDGWHIDDIMIYEPASLVPEPADFAIESTNQFTSVNDGPEYSETTGGGSWFTSVSKPRLSQVRTTRSRYRVLGSPGSTASYTPQFALSGEWDVYVAWGDYANSLNVRYIIEHANGTDEVFLDQNSPVNGHQWHHLGSYTFEKGRNGSVTVDDSTITGPATGISEGRVYADAVWFVYRPEQVERQIENGWVLY